MARKRDRSGLFDRASDTQYDDNSFQRDEQEGPPSFSFGPFAPYAPSRPKTDLRQKRDDSEGEGKGGLSCILTRDPPSKETQTNFEVPTLHESMQEVPSDVFSKSKHQILHELSDFRQEGLEAKSKRTAIPITFGNPGSGHHDSSSSPTGHMATNREGAAQVLHSTHRQSKSPKFNQNSDLLPIFEEKDQASALRPKSQQVARPALPMNKAMRQPSTPPRQEEELKHFEANAKKQVIEVTMRQSAGPEGEPSEARKSEGSVNGKKAKPSSTAVVKRNTANIGLNPEAVGSRAKDFGTVETLRSSP